MFIVSGGERSRELKVTLGVKRSDSHISESGLASPRSGLGHSFWVVLCQQTVRPVNNTEFRKYRVGSITEWMFAFCQVLVVHLPCGWSMNPRRLLCVCLFGRIVEPLKFVLPQGQMLSQMLSQVTAISPHITSLLAFLPHFTVFHVFWDAVTTTSRLNSVLGWIFRLF